MKQLIIMLLLCGAMLTGCSSGHGITTIQPTTGSIEIEARGELRVWKDIKHGRFTVTLTNPSALQSVELYKVERNGNEKWVSPSLLASTSLEVALPADGHLLIKNFNANTFTITYKIAE